MKGMLGVLALIALFTLRTAAAEPVERIVWGEVVEVIPITETIAHRRADSCDDGRPVGASLAATLRWDLRPECVRRDNVRTLGYRVSYRWDGRTYVRQMDKKPGRRVPLLVKIAAVDESR